MNNIVKCILTLCIILIPAMVFAQDPADPGSDPDVPIDGGISLLVGAAAAYGASKLRRRNDQPRR